KIKSKLRSSTLPSASPWQHIEYASLEVGDLIRIEAGEEFPADILFLKSSDRGGQCFIETSNLDGETNKKIKTAVMATQSMDLISEILPLKSATIECEQPNIYLDRFHGILEISTGDEIPLSTSNLLLRGSQLVHTSWIVGVVLYTGDQT